MKLANGHVICDVCGIDMFDEELCVPMVGIDINIIDKRTNANVKIHKEAQRLLDELGVTEFQLCFVCWFKSMGVKSKNPNAFHVAK